MDRHTDRLTFSIVLTAAKPMTWLATFYDYQHNIEYQKTK